MTSDYEKKWMDRIHENAKRRERYAAEMYAERDRIIRLFQKRGIPQVDRPVDRSIWLKNNDGFGRIEHTYFQIPEDIDLRKVVEWLHRDTKYYDFVVYLVGWNPTTIYSEDGIEYFFKYAPVAHERYLAEHKEG